ncbi:hypothetical protein M3Y97_00133300 [Aphelenchoides bicaudatus]|nr:hypothetical protein M3Y97_00133300 [Aphelenchoides bicaudatus]
MRATMALINIRHWHFTYEIVVGSLAFLSNFLLIYLAIYKTGKHMQKYSLVLIQNCLVDIVFNMLNMIFVPVVEMKDGNLFYMLGGPLEHLEKPYTCLFWMLFLEGLLICIINVPLQFVYRYLMVVKNIQLSVWKYLGLFFVGFIIVTVHCTLGFFVFYPTDQVIETHKHYLTEDPIWMVDTPDFIVGDKHDIISLLHFLNCMLIINTSYAIVFWCSYKIWHALKLFQSNISRKKRDTQNQLTKILFIQAFMPFVILSAPVCVVIVTSIIGKSVPALGISLALTVSWMPIVNAVSAILIVPSYRQWLISFGRTKTMPENTTQQPQSMITQTQPQTSNN